MELLICYCPACRQKLTAQVLKCPSCQLEMKNEFALSPFDYLTSDHQEFLTEFLRARGNMKALQEKMDISYPTAKKKLEQLIAALGIVDEATSTEEFDMSLYRTKNATAPSEIIINKLIDVGGKATVTSLDGSEYEIALDSDGKTMLCSALPPYEFRVFDIIVNLARREGGRVKKGQARGKQDKIGSDKCNEHTITGIIGIEYYRKSIGDSVFDPVFVLSAVLEWAGIAHNRRGYIELTQQYLQKG